MLDQACLLKSPLNNLIDVLDISAVIENRIERLFVEFFRDLRVFFQHAAQRLRTTGLGMGSHSRIKSGAA